MHRYSIYIMKQLAQAATLITLSLTSIIWLTQALRFIDFIVDRGLSFVSFLALTLMLVPSLMLFVVPFAMLCSVLFVYYRLMMDSELLVLSGAGLSRLQVARPAINVAIGATLLCYLISLYLLPVSYREFKNMQSFLHDNYASLLLQEDVFNSPIDGLTVYIHDRDKSGILHGIIVHDSRDTKKPPVTMMAEQGKLLQTPQGPRFMLYNGSRQEVENGKLSFLNFDQYTLDISFYAAAEGARERQPEEMFLWELLYPKGATAAEAARLLAEGNNRLSWPLFPLALTMLSMAVLLTGQFNRRGQWRRICAVVGIASVALAASVGFLNMAVLHPWIIALMYGNAALLIGVSMWHLGDRVSHKNHILRQ